MELTLKTKYDIGDLVVVDKELVGTIVGIVIKINPIPENKNVFISDKVYLVNVKGDIIEIDEDLLEKYDS